jgi:hypothetical protein
LALAARIALGGEASVDDTLRARFEAGRQIVVAARKRGDDQVFAARGARLEHDVRSGAVSPRLVARAFGDFDPRRGVDGVAKLACDVRLARGRVALAADDLDAARREIAAARATCRASRSALEAVELAERELAARER